MADFVTPQAVSNTLDTTAPTFTVTSVSPTSGNTAAIGDPIVVTVTAGGAETGLTASGTQSINGQTAVFAETSGGEYTITDTVGVGDGDVLDANALTVSITLQDSSSNIGTEITSIVAGTAPGIDSTRPAFSSATTISDTQIEITVDTSVSDNSAAIGDFTLGGVASGSIGSIVSTSGTTITLGITGATVTDTDTITISYTRATGSFSETSGNVLLDFSGESVVNTLGAPTYTAVSNFNTQTTVTFSKPVDGTLTLSQWTFAGQTATAATANISGATGGGTLADDTSIIFTHPSVADQTPDVIYTAGNIQDNDTIPLVSATVTATDGIAPTAITNLDLVSGGSDATLSAEGDVLTLTFTTNEAITTPTITIAGEAPDVGPTDLGSATSWSATYTTAEADVVDASTAAVSVTFADLAGNAGSGSPDITLDSGGVTFDFTAPTVAITYSTAGPYKSGAPVTITATFNEAVADSPVPQLSISGANTIATTNMVKSSTTVYTFAHTVGTGDGTATVAMATAEDAAGNLVVSTPTSGATFTVDNTAPLFVEAFVSGTKSIVVAYNEPVITSAGEYTSITVGAQSTETGSSLVGSTTPSITVIWSTATASSSGTDSGITFDIETTVTDLAGNLLGNSGTKVIAATIDATEITTATLTDTDSDGTVDIALTDDTLIETIVAPAGTTPIVDVSAFTDSGAGTATFPATTITVESSTATIEFPPSVEVSGFSASETIEVTVSIKVPDAAFATAFPDLNLSNVDVVEFGDPDVDLTFSVPVKITIPGLAGTVFSINAAGATLEIQACDVTVINSATADTFIGTITGTAILDGEACFVNTDIWTKHFSGFGGSGSSGGGGSGDSTPPSFSVGFTQNEFPLRYDGVNYQSYQFETIHTAQIKTGEESQTTLTVYENSGAGNMKHVELYVNQHGSQILNDLTETIVIYDEQSGLEIIDPHNLIATANVVPSISGNKSVFDFTVIFKDEIPQSDVLFRAWDIKRNSVQFLLPDALMVTISEQSSNIISITPESGISDTEPESESVVPEATPGTSETVPGISEPVPEVELQTKTWTDGQLSVLKQWGGYDVETASDADVLSKFGIKGEQIPPYVKHLVKWILDDQVNQEEFVNALQYLKRTGALSNNDRTSSFNVQPQSELEEFTLNTDSLSDNIKFKFNDSSDYFRQANLGDLEDKIRTLRSLANNAEIQKELINSNDEFETFENLYELTTQRDIKWSQNPNTITPFMATLMDNDSALMAKAIIEHHKDDLVPLTSIAITNAYGANVIITEKTQDYMQNDESWWSNTKTDGVYVMSGSNSEGYSGVYTAELSVSVNDDDGHFIGIIKATVNFEKALLE
ncbi:MAG: hypothetical protein HRU07_04860 [Nitrosopumilus sp.]|nr:hypothetical protein [Nitrosopumilus sp.]NRA05483.1 hypothetical protein [Nitrosopumilus sp.]